MKLYFPKWFGFLFLLSIVLFVVYVWVVVDTAGGRPVAPLDDAYIHFQYARQLANGYPWQYNDGDPPSTGATSLLYPFLLAVGLLVQLPDENVVWLTLILGWLAFVGSAVLVARLTHHLLASNYLASSSIKGRIPLLSGVLFLLTGAVQWGFFNGMETGLFTFFILLALERFLADDYSGAAVGMALAGLTRPEGLLLAGGMWLVAISQHRYSARRQYGHVILPLTIAVVISGLPFIVNFLLTGEWMATGSTAKSWFQNVPFRPADILLSVARSFGRIQVRMALGILGDTLWYIPPFILFFALAGWLALAHNRKWVPLMLTSAWYIIGTLASATLITATWQAGRYQIPYVAILYPVAVTGAVTFLFWLPAKLRPVLALATALFIFLFGLESTLQAIRSYRLSIHTIANQHVLMADWIDENLPAGAHIAVHDAGAIRYLSNRAIYDMIGLTTQDVALAWRNGSGSIFENMERSPDRPTHFSTYPVVMAIPYLAQTDLFTTELVQFTVPEFSPFSVASDTQGVFVADWQLAGSGDLPRQSNVVSYTKGLMLINHVDLADLADETEKGLAWWEGDVRSGFPTEVRQMTYRTDSNLEVLDGGRLLTGGLVLNTLVDREKPLLLVTRLHAQDEGAVDVWLDSQKIGNWRYPASPGEWQESMFLIPAGAIKDDQVEIKLTVKGKGRFEPYYIWFYQGEPDVAPNPPEEQTTIRFGNNVRLIGFDPPMSSLSPGESISFTLYWMGEASVEEDSVVFVHLYDEDGNLVAQQDQRPYFGIRPHYNWLPGEVIVDPRVLQLPESLPQGHYTIAIGLYDPSSGVRWEAQAPGEFMLSNNRVILTTIFLK